LPQFFQHSKLLPVADVAIMELYKEHRTVQVMQRQVEMLLLGITLLVITTTGISIAQLTLIALPSVHVVWLILIPFDACGFLFLVIHSALNCCRWSSS